jgi:AcrR family transcriptional regulator
MPTGTKAKGEGARGFHHGDLPTALVAAATALIVARKGPDFSLREVAESVGVSHTAAYRHFAAKADLLAEIAARGFNRLAKAIDGAIVRRDGAVDAIASLEKTGLAYLDFAERHPGAYRVMFFVELCDATRHSALAEAANCALASLVGIVAAGQSDGTLRADRPAATIAAAVWAAVHGHAVLTLDGQIRDVGAPGEAPPADRRLLLDMILGGIAARPAPTGLTDR